MSGGDDLRRPRRERHALHEVLRESRHGGVVDLDPGAIDSDAIAGNGDGLSVTVARY
jgi:hypothetical protein